MYGDEPMLLKEEQQPPDRTGKRAATYTANSVSLTDSANTAAVQRMADIYEELSPHDKTTMQRVAEAFAEPRKTAKSTKVKRNALGRSKKIPSERKEAR